MEQLDQQLADAETPESPPEKRGRGRPKGSKNAPKAAGGESSVVAVPVDTLAAPEKPKPARKPSTDTERVNALATSFSGLWDMAAEAFDDDLLRVTPQEAMDWASPVHRTLKQLGQDHQVEKLAPLEAIGQTVKIAAPRLKRIAFKRAMQPRSDAPPPQFKTRSSPRRAESESAPDRPPFSVSPQPSSGADSFDPSVGAGYDKPLPFDPRNLVS